MINFYYFKLEIWRNLQSNIYKIVNYILQRERVGIPVRLMLIWVSPFVLTELGSKGEGFERLHRACYCLFVMSCLSVMYIIPDRVAILIHNWNKTQNWDSNGWPQLNCNQHLLNIMNISVYQNQPSFSPKCFFSTLFDMISNGRCQTGAIECRQMAWPNAYVIRTIPDKN
jgi:hypothetical protein